MAFKEVQSLDADNTISLGGYNKKTRKDNPTKAEGYFIGSRSVPSKLAQSGFAQLHILQTPQGNLGVWGKSDLDRKMGQVPAGAMIRITQTGTKPSNKGNDMYTFKVEVDAENTIEVSESLSAGGAEFSGSGTGVANDEYVSEGLDEEEEYLDEVVPARPSRPVHAAAAPDAARQAKVKELLSKSRSKTA